MDTIPELSPEGFTSNKAIIMTKLYEYFISSHYSQTNLFRGDIASLKYIISEASNRFELESMTRDALFKMYNRYFGTVVINVTSKDTDNVTGISVDIVATDYDGREYVLSKLVNIVDNNIITYDKEMENTHEQ